jgi:hypothetical protein
LVAGPLAAARARLADTIAAEPEPRAVIAGARDLALAMADLLTAALLVEQAATGDARAAVTADLWVRRRLARVDVDATAAAVYDTLLPGA